MHKMYIIRKNDRIDPEKRGDDDFLGGGNFKYFWSVHPCLGKMNPF